MFGEIVDETDLLLCSESNILSVRIDTSPYSLDFSECFENAAKLAEMRLCYRIHDLARCGRRISRAHASYAGLHKGPNLTLDVPWPNTRN